MTKRYTAEQINSAFSSAADDVAAAGDLYADELAVVCAHIAEWLPADSEPFADELVNVIVNRCADQYLAAAQAPDTGLRDAVNLLVNAAATYLDDPDADLAAVAQGSYDEDLDVIVEWIQS